MNSSQYVVFSLGQQEYGIDIALAQEVIRIPEQITKIPDTSTYVEGMVNLRNKIIPVIDLKKRFKFEQTARTSDSRLLILNLEDMILGTIVDDVAEVLKIDEQAIEALNTTISSVGSNSVKGIGKIANRLILLLDAIKLKTEVLSIVN